MTKKEIILIFILVAIAIVRFLFFIPEKPTYSEVINKQIIFEGIVTENPDKRIYNQQLIVSVMGQKTNILVTVPKELEIFYGDKVKIFGILETPENFITEAGREFNYKRYLANKDIYFVVRNANIEIISHNNGNKLKSELYKIRNSFMKNIEKAISPPESFLASGLLLGARGGFDNNMREKFIETGTIHIVALSGYNISVISGNIISFLGLFLSQIFSSILAIILILLFILMTGATATAVRAGIMAGIILLARITGRNYLAGRALIIAGLLMICYDLRVVTDLSFQLSFLATGGILFIMPKIINWFRFLPIRFKIRETVATTFSATIAVLPILLYSTGIFSIISLPANVLILPIIPVTMFFSFLGGIFGYVLPIVAIPFAFIAQLLLSYILFIVNFFSSLPFASFSIQSFPLILTIIIYLFLFWWVFRKQKQLTISK
jgi:competence protein ComEC